MEFVFISCAQNQEKRFKQSDRMSITLDKRVYPLVPLMLSRPSIIQYIFFGLQPLMGSRIFSFFIFHSFIYQFLSTFPLFSCFSPPLDTSSAALLFSIFYSMLAAHCSTTGCNVFQISERFFIRTKENSTGPAVRQ